jgi:hypothetical protein
VLPLIISAIIESHSTIIIKIALKTLRHANSLLSSSVYIVNSHSQKALCNWYIKEEIVKIYTEFELF